MARRGGGGVRRGGCRRRWDGRKTRIELHGTRRGRGGGSPSEGHVGVRPRVLVGRREAKDQLLRSQPENSERSQLLADTFKLRRVPLWVFRTKILVAERTFADRNPSRRPEPNQFHSCEVELERRNVGCAHPRDLLQRDLFGDRFAWVRGSRIGTASNSSCSSRPSQLESSAGLQVVLRPDLSPDDTTTAGVKQCIAP